MVLFPEPLNPKAEAVLAANGYPDPSHTARQLEQEDIGGDVLLLTMEDRQKSQIWETFENAPMCLRCGNTRGRVGMCRRFTASRWLCTVSVIRNWNCCCER